MVVKENLQKITSDIVEVCQKVGRDPQEVKVIAVTKYVSIARAQEAIEAGISNIGENRDEGLLEKWETIGRSCTWHFIGSLQSRKVKNIIDHVDYIHSLDRTSLAKEIDKRAAHKIKCFVQVNASGETSKQGLNPSAVVSFIKELHRYPNIEVVGLMTMAPLTTDEQVLRATFSQVKTLQKEVQALQLTYAPCLELSMGMSQDYRMAIEEGATYIRIGTALVGNETKG